MCMRTINIEMFKKLLGQFGIAQTSNETGVSVHTLIKMAAPSYGNREPNAMTRKALCRFFSVSEDSLFPLVRDEAG